MVSKDKCFPKIVLKGMFSVGFCQEDSEQLYIGGIFAKFYNVQRRF